MTSYIDWTIDESQMAETSTLPRAYNWRPEECLVSLLGGDAKSYNVVDIDGQNLAGHILLHDVGTRSVSNLLLTEYHFQGNHGADYCVTRQLGFPVTVDPDDANSAVTSIQHGWTRDSFVERLSHFISPTDLGSYSQHAKITWTSTPTDVDIEIDAGQATPHPAIHAFSEGIEGSEPTAAAIDAASRIASAALEKTVEPEITVDVDGALSFDFRLADGLLVLAELDVNGHLDASVYDDRKGVLVKRLPQTTHSELIALF